MPRTCPGVCSTALREITNVTVIAARCAGRREAKPEGAVAFRVPAGDEGRGAVDTMKRCAHPAVYRSNERFAGLKGSV